MERSSFSFLLLFIIVVKSSIPYLVDYNFTNISNDNTKRIDQILTQKLIPVDTCDLNNDICKRTVNGLLIGANSKLSSSIYSVLNNPVCPSLNMSFMYRIFFDFSDYGQNLGEQTIIEFQMWNNPPSTYKKSILFNIAYDNANKNYILSWVIKYSFDPILTYTVFTLPYIPAGKNYGFNDFNFYYEFFVPSVKGYYTNPTNYQTLNELANKTITDRNVQLSNNYDNYRIYLGNLTTLADHKRIVINRIVASCTYLALLNYPSTYESTTSLNLPIVSPIEYIPHEFCDSSCTYGCSISYSSSDCLISQGCDPSCPVCDQTNQYCYVPCVNLPSGTDGGTPQLKSQIITGDGRYVCFCKDNTVANDQCQNPATCETQISDLTKCAPTCLTSCLKESNKYLCVDCQDPTTYPFGNIVSSLPSPGRSCTNFKSCICAPNTYVHNTIAGLCYYNGTNCNLKCNNKCYDQTASEDVCIDECNPLSNAYNIESIIPDLSKPAIVKCSCKSATTEANGICFLDDTTLCDIKCDGCTIASSDTSCKTCSTSVTNIQGSKNTNNLWTCKCRAGFSANPYSNNDCSITTIGCDPKCKSGCLETDANKCLDCQNSIYNIGKVIVDTNYFNCDCTAGTVQLNPSSYFCVYTTGCSPLCNGNCLQFNDPTLCISSCNVKGINLIKSDNSLGISTCSCATGFFSDPINLWLCVVNSNCHMNCNGKCTKIQDPYSCYESCNPNIKNIINMKNGDGSISCICSSETVPYTNYCVYDNGCHPLCNSKCYVKNDSSQCADGCASINDVESDKTSCYCKEGFSLSENNKECSANGLSMAGIIGIAVGVGIFCLGLGAIILYYFCYRKSAEVANRDSAIFNKSSSNLIQGNTGKRMGRQIPDYSDIVKDKMNRI